MNQDFPVLCKNCLGSNPFLRMIKRPLNDECKMCSKVFTSFNWKKDKESKYLKTLICKNCSNLKNICQCCILDLEFNIPLFENDIDSLRTKPKEQIITLKKKIIHPSDKDIKTLFISGLDSNMNQSVTEQDLKVNFEPYGKILSIKRINNDTALITFKNRLDAEIAIESLYNKLIINNITIKVLWAKQKKLKNLETFETLDNNNLFQENDLNQDFNLAPPPSEFYIYPSMKSIASKISPFK